MNLADMRLLVRTQLDLDESDLPDALLDAFLQQGYDLALGLEQTWPSFQTQWAVSADTAGVVTLPIDVGQIELLVDGGGNVLSQTPGRWMYLSVGPGTIGTPMYWCRFGPALRVSPVPSVDDAPFTMTAFGYRLGSDWIAQGAGAECDCDRRLHLPICWYAASLGYAQQEDEVLEATYLNRFKETVGQARDSIMRVWSAQPHRASYTSFPRTPSTAFPGGPSRVLIYPPTVP